MPDLIDFLKAVASQWLSTMAGGVSVLLAIVSQISPVPRVFSYLFCASAVACFLWAIFSAWKVERRKAEGLQAMVASQGALEMDYIPGERPFEETEGGMYRQTRMLSIRLRNVGGSPVRHCKLYLVSIEPNEGRRAYDVKMDTFDPVNLNPGDRDYALLVTHNEHGPAMSGGTFGILNVPVASDSGWSPGPWLSMDTDYIVTLRATGDGAAACVRQFRISIKDGRLRMAAL